jgi:hypothetical protein
MVYCLTEFSCPRAVFYGRRPSWTRKTTITRIKTTKTAKATKI